MDKDKQLMDLYNKIIQNDSVDMYNTNSNSFNEELNGISVGDYVIFNNKNIEYGGDVKNIHNEKYLIRCNSSNGKQDFYILYNDIVEHYPKNIKFNNKKQNILKEDFLKSPLISNDVKIKNDFVKVFANETKQKEIDIFLSSNKNIKYFIVEKNNELHIVKIKEGFEIKPFVESVINHLLKNKSIKENIQNMKVVGNGTFCIIKNSSSSIKNLIKNVLLDILK